MYRLSQRLQTISIQERTAARLQAQRDSVEYNPTRLVLYSDASFNKGNAAIAVVWKTGPTKLDWHSKHVALSDVDLSVNQLEFCAIMQAFSIAALLCGMPKAGARGSQYDTVVVYTDSTSAIRPFISPEAASREGFGDNLFDAEKLGRALDVLQRSNVKLELHWSPGHDGVDGNILADKACVKAGALSRRLREELKIDDQRVISSTNVIRSARPNTKATHGPLQRLTTWMLGFVSRPTRAALGIRRAPRALYLSSHAKEWERLEREREESERRRRAQRMKKPKIGKIAAAVVLSHSSNIVVVRPATTMTDQKVVPNRVEGQATFG